MMSAQSQCSKGHFIFGSDLVQYSSGTTTVNNYVANVQKDTLNNSFSNLSYGFNVWAGYYITNRFCAGLTFDFRQTPLEYYAYSYYYYYYPAQSFLPSNLFFRYYIVHADSGGFLDLGVDGNFGVGYTSSQNTISDGTPGTSANTSITYQIDYFNLSSGINLLASFHISKHFALQFMGGLAGSYQSLNLASETISPPNRGYSFTPYEVTFTTFQFNGSFRLQFYL